MSNRKSKVTNELRNGFPDWSRVRSDDQSVGASFLNVIGIQLEDLNTELYRAFNNQILTTAFVGEMDQVYKVVLPNSFTFEVINENSLSQELVAPTVSGLTVTGWIPVEDVSSGSTKEFWYDALPSRFIESATYSIDSTLIASGLSSDLSLQILDDGSFIDNRLTVIADGQVLVGIDSDNNIQRSRVRIHGTTWKDVSDTEDIVFLFSDSKQTLKPWTSIDRIECVDFYSDSLIYVYGHRFNQLNYRDSFETLSQTESSRENLPLFWNVESGNTTTILNLQKYSIDVATDLLSAKPQFINYKQWDLYDSNNNSIRVLDIIPIPYQQKVFALTATKLFIYDTYQELPNLKLLDLNMQNTLIKLEVSNDYPILNEEVEIMSLFQRPVKTIIKHRISITFPDGIKFGIAADGSMVTSDTDYYIYNETSDRFIRPSVFLEVQDYGEHIITLECTYLDNTTEIVQRLILPQHKLPLKEYDININNPVGIDIDHQNRLLILDSSNIIHHLEPHYDVMVINYIDKEITFREKYLEVKIGVR